MSTKKTESTQKLLEKVALPWPVPVDVPGASLLEHGLVAILMRRMSAEDAQASLLKLKQVYGDWNELRVSQAQEIAQALSGPRKVGLEAARDIKDYLQEIFQESHGLDLEFLRDDFQAASRFGNELSYLGLATLNWLLIRATGEKVLVTPAIVRVLDRVGLAPRTASQKRARVAVEPLVPKGEEQRFAMVMGHVAQMWCDARKPICWECPLVEDCKHGKKVFRDWRVQQERLEVQRAREAVRQQKLERQEAERQRREAEREAKRAEAEAQKKAREEQRKKKQDEREKQKRDQQAARLKAAAEREKQKLALAQKKKVEAERAAKKKAAEAARKKAALERAAEKAAAKAAALAAKKKAEQKKQAPRRSGSSGKTKRRGAKSKPTKGTRLRSAVKSAAARAKTRVRSGDRKSSSKRTTAKRRR